MEIEYQQLREENGMANIISVIFGRADPIKLAQKAAVVQYRHQLENLAMFSDTFLSALVGSCLLDSAVFSSEHVLRCTTLQMVFSAV